MSFNEDKKQPRNLTCKDCKAFVLGANPPEGICALNPPQVIVDEDSVFSIFPNVDGDGSFCLKLIPKRRDGKGVRSE